MPPDEANEENNKEKRKPLTLMDYQRVKTEERTSRSTKKGKKTNHSGDTGDEVTGKNKIQTTNMPQNKLRKSTESVVINVGIIRENDKWNLQIVWGSKLPIRVTRDATAKAVLQHACKKYSDHDQFFCPVEDYLLLYPDQNVFDVIPGTSISFTVEKYKKELSKPFSKIDLYVRKPHDLETNKSRQLLEDLSRPIDYLSNESNSIFNTIEDSVISHPNPDMFMNIYLPPKK